MAGREDVFQKSMNMGHSAAWDQQWERAAGFYRIGEILESEINDADGAVEQFARALSTDPTCVPAFKALGRALRVACEPDPRRDGVASTKGSLG